MYRVENDFKVRRIFLGAMDLELKEKVKQILWFACKRKTHGKDFNSLSCARHKAHGKEPVSRSECSISITPAVCHH
jgi:hypothetical protein